MSAGPAGRSPLPPDLPQELARTYGKGLKGLRVRSLLVFLLAAAALVPCLLPSLPVSLPRSWRWDIPSSSGSPPGFWGQVCCCLSTCWPPACGAV